MVLGNFKIALRLRDWHVFMWQSAKISNVFNTLTLKQIFWIVFQKTGVPFLVESTKIENASFPDKRAISEANVKTNRMVSTKWTYHKGRSFASNYLIFLKILFPFKIELFPYNEFIWCTNEPNAHIRTFCKRWSFIWRCFFLVSILNVKPRLHSFIY